VVVVMGLMVKGTRILVVDPPKSWLRVPQKVMPRNPDKLAYANSPAIVNAKKASLMRDPGQTHGTGDAAHVSRSKPPMKWQSLKRTVQIQRNRLPNQYHLVVLDA